MINHSVTRPSSPLRLPDTHPLAGNSPALVDAVWGTANEPVASLLRVHLAHIRQKLEPDPSRPRYFITEPGVGYRFEPEST